VQSKISDHREAERNNLLHRHGHTQQSTPSIA
jgi:hypothetical protein